MSEPQVPNSFQWLEDYYHETLDDWEVPFGGISSCMSDSTSFGDDFFPGSGIILTSNIPEDTISGPHSAGSDTGIPALSPEKSSSGSNDLSPKSTIAKKVTRRRSRASRRAPTTLLNASIKNFQTIVQQYTGYRSATSAFKRKGPIILSFGPSSEQNDFPASFTAAFGRGNYYTDQPQFQQHYHQQHVDQMYPEN